MRAGLIAAALSALALALVPVPAAHAETTCGEAACGTPDCWEPTVRTRPGVTRLVGLGCANLEGAKLISKPPHSEVANISLGFYRMTFDVHADEDAPRFEEAVFELTGHDGTSAELRVKVEVVPTSENSPPECRGDSATQRSDGTGPVDLFMHPYCRDVDGDDFTMYGGGPGVHPDAPKHVNAGESESNWNYRTATFSGDESATVWAVDSLGARSEDAPLDVTIGPVDRLPECGQGSWSDGPLRVYSRPGAIRRMGLLCTDADGDLFTSRLSSLPQRGLIPEFVEGPPWFGYWGAERWIDATYVPVDDSIEPDPFSVTATGLAGDGPEAHMSIIPRASANAGGGCGWSPANVVGGVAATVQINCEDNDGDPLTAEVVNDPPHGTTTPPVVSPALYGRDNITVAYLADLAYDGYDCVKVRISDGHGMEFTITVDIWVTAGFEVPEVPEVPVVPPDVPQVPVDPPEVPQAPVDPPTTDPPAVPDPPADDPPLIDPPAIPQPPAPPADDPPGAPDQPADDAPVIDPPGLPEVPATDGPAADDPPAADSTPLPAASGHSANDEPAAPDPPATAPIANPVPVVLPPPLPSLPTAPTAREVRRSVQQALGTRGVKRLRSAGGTQVWARTQVSRSDLLRYGRAPGLVVVCVKRCMIRSTALLAPTPRRAARRSRAETAVAATAGQPQVLSLSITRAERRALRRTPRARAKFTVKVRPGGSARRSIPLAR